MPGEFQNSSHPPEKLALLVSLRCPQNESLAESITLKADWGHSSNIIAVDLCHAARAKRLALFHHEPTYSDDAILRMHVETLRYEELTRSGAALEVICSYDGLVVEV